MARYKNWSVFPSPAESVRKITMKVTLGSPDSLLTAHWDYLDHITIRRQGGVNAESLNYELGRMLTPYGSRYGKGWSWQWEVNVTDFAPFLRDSMEIEYAHSGYEATTVGWALTIDFEITLGPEVIKPLGITPLWCGKFKYGDPEAKIEDYLLPITYQSLANSSISRIRIQHTGHGMDKPNNCSEFCSRWRELKIDGERIDLRDMWKDCGNNPLYPQGGTWLYDRAYWCPGDLQVPDIVDIPTEAGKHKVEITMEPYTATENIQAVENIAAYLFQYTAPKAKNDLAVDKIMVPTDEQQFKRLNPAAFHPRFVIRNLGSETLRSAVIQYGTEGFPQKKYLWKGQLEFNETAEIVMPDKIDSNTGLNQYNVEITKPNGKRDAWMGDNKISSTFSSPKIFPTKLIVQLMTNNKPEDNNLSLYNKKNEVLFEKESKSLKANTLYQDTVILDAGNYELNLTDSAGNGLEYWAQPQQGNGYLRILDISGNLLHTFESDCGNGEKIGFVASNEFKLDTTITKIAFSVHPLLVEKHLNLEMVANKTVDMKVVLTVNGQVYEKHAYNKIRKANYRYNFDNIPQGRIVVEAIVDGESSFKARVNKK